MWYQADKDLTFPIDYMVEGEFVIPSSASVTLRDNTGVVDVTIVDQPLSVTSTSTSVIIPAIKNSIAAGLLFENRFLALSFVHNNRTYHQNFRYSLYHFVPIAVTPEDVRVKIGLDSTELPDQDIDVVRAYLDLSSIENVDIRSHLVLGDSSTLISNELVAIQATLNVLPSLELRVAQETSSENSSFKRVSSIDFANMRSNLLDFKAQFLRLMSPIKSVVPNIFGVTSPKDALTNA